MPELPEVEYTARQLRNSVIGAEINAVDVFWSRTISHPDAATFVANVIGQRIAGVRRRGKFLVVDLSPAREGSTIDNMLLTIHRRMTGNLLLLPPGWEIDTSLRERDEAAWDRRGPTFIPPDPSSLAASNGSSIQLSDTDYCRVCFTFSDGRRLLYTDPRKFGRIACWPLALEHEVFAALGSEPLSADFSVESLAQRLAGRKAAIKQVLLDQTVVAGLGNIYADEALFFARIHPQRAANSLAPQEISQLHAAIVTILTHSIEYGGTSFSGYRDLWGEAGENYNHVLVYQQEGKPCPRCGTIIERMVIAQRSAHFCPTCQLLVVTSA